MSCCLTAQNGEGVFVNEFRSEFNPRSLLRADKKRVYLFKNMSINK